MARYYNLLMDAGTSQGPYSAYADSVSPSNLLALYDGTGYYQHITFAQATTPPGIGVIVPDSALNVVVVNEIAGLNIQQVIFVGVPSVTPSPTVTLSPSVTPSPSPVGYQFGTYTAGSPGSAPTPYTDSTTACRQSDTLTGQNLYQKPADGATPLVGAQLYTDLACTTAWNPSIGGNRWFKLGRSSTYWAVEVSTGGAIQTVINCTSIPSTTPSATVTQTPTVTPTISTTASVSITPTPTISTTASVSRTPSITPTPSPVGFQFGTYTSGAPGSAPTDYGDSATACRQSDTLTGQNLYQKPADGGTPNVGAQLYTDLACTVAWAPAIGSSRWFKLGRSSTYWAVQVSIGGIVQAVTACTLIPSNTPSASITPTPTKTPTPTQTPTISTTATVSSTPSATVTPTISTTASVSRTPSVTPTPSPVGFQFGTYTSGAPGSAPTDYANSATACRQSDTLTGQNLYQKPADGATPNPTAQLYTNVSCTTAWSPSIPGNRWFKLGRSGVYWAVEVSTGGVIQTVINCTNIPSNTPSATVTPTPTPTTSIIRTPAYTSQGYQTCYSTTLYPVYLDTNPNSYTYNHYFAGAGTIDLGTSPPAAGNNTDVWVDNESTRCNIVSNVCYEEKQQTQTNPCGASGNGATRWVSNPGGTACNTTQNWVDEGSTFCSDCYVYQTQRQTNPCATGYNTTRNVKLGQGAPCDYAAHYTNSVGTLWTCSSGNVINSFEVLRNSNPCFSGNQFYSNGNTYVNDPSNSENDVAEVYSLHRCSDGATLFSVPYCIGYLIPGVRVELSDGTVCYVITTLPTSYADVYSVTQIAGAGCPTTYTQFQSPCDGSYYFYTGALSANFYFSTDVPYQCIDYIGGTTSPLGSEIYNISIGDCGGCP